VSLNKEDIKSKIKEELRKLEQDIKALKELTKPISPENTIGRISRMDAINNKSINEASLRQSEDRLRKLKLALEKVDNSDFGICIRCKQAIPVGRIMLMPHTQKCVKCA